MRLGGPQVLRIRTNPPRGSLSGVPYLASPLAHGFSGAFVRGM